MKTKHKKMIILAVMIFVISAIFLFIVTYVFRVESPLINSVKNTLHLPAIIVDGRWISIKEVDENTASIKQFYESQREIYSDLGVRIDFDTEDGQKRLLIQKRKMLNNLVEGIAIAEIAKEWDITISDEAVQSAMERPMAEAGTQEAVKERLEKLYGWTLDDFGEKVVRRQLLEEKVAAKFEQENRATDEMRAKIDAVRKELQNGRDFADLAKQYSEGATAENGGVMGWFESRQLQDTIGDTITKMEVDTYSDVIETPLALHIVYLNDVHENDKGDKLYLVSHIIVKKQTFAAFLAEHMKQMHVREFLPLFVWNKGRGQFDFADTSLADFEVKMQQQALDLQKELLQ